MSTVKTYPAGSILATMKLDIHASKKRNDVWIMHDAPFENKLKQLVFYSLTQQLEFHFTNGTVQNLGGYVGDELAPHFEKVDTVTLYQLDPKTLAPLAVLDVPLKIETSPSDHHEENLNDLSDIFQHKVE